MGSMNIVGLQFDIVWENKAANFEKIRRLLGEAAPAKNSLVALPEFSATGFSLDTAAIADAPGGETEQFLRRTAAEFGVCLMASVPVRGPDGRTRNRALVVAPSGELLADYAKMRPFTLGGEAAHYAAGDHPVAFPWDGWTVAPFICFDLRFPELFRAAAATHQPHLFTVIANWPASRIHHWLRLLQARAIENQAWVLGVNRTGRDPLYVYNGHSVIIDPQGEIIADAGENEGAISHSLDLPALLKYRATLPFLADMRAITIQPNILPQKSGN